jgi:hypothetical protein
MAVERQAARGAVLGLVLIKVILYRLWQLKRLLMVEVVCSCRGKEASFGGAGRGGGCEGAR